MVSINTLKKQKDGSDMAKWTTPDRLYLSEDGEVVDEAAPGRKTLLAPAGSQVSDEVCRRHRLGPYAPAGAEVEETDAEAAGSCCPHVFRVHRKADGQCGQRRHCGCQGWQPEAEEEKAEAEGGGGGGGSDEGGAGDQDPGEGEGAPEDGDGGESEEESSE